MIRPAETLSLHEKNIGLPGDAELQASSNAVSTPDKMRRRNGRTDFVGCLLEQAKPAVEMPGIHREGQVLLHRPPVINAAHEDNRGPESAHALKMRLPVGDPLVEDWTQELIRAHLAVEGVH